MLVLLTVIVGCVAVSAQKRGFIAFQSGRYFCI